MGLFGWLRRRRRKHLHEPHIGPPAPPSAVLGFAVIDVETSGLDAAHDRIVEVAVVRTDTAGRPIDEWTTLLDPCGPVGATYVHGIATADVRGAPQFADVVGELNARLAGRAVVAHNALFDLAFLRAEYARAGWSLPPIPNLCTLEASSQYLPYLDRRRLQDCCWAFHLAHQDSHSALGDARAAASLLARYLAVAQHLHPRPTHLALAEQATQVRWPPIPIRPIRLATRPTGRVQDPPAPAGTLWTLLDDLPLSSSIEHGAPSQATAYLELLFAVLEDGVLTGEEARALVEVANVYALDRDQIHAAHRGFLLALAHRIVEDGKVTRDERALLTGAAAALGVDADLPSRVLDEARTARDQHRSADCQPLPPDWSHGEPLRVGQPVTFTGCDPIERAQLEGRAIAAGLRVTGTVTTKTATLVTDGANPNTVKARRARDLGTRTVSPDVFAYLLTHIQPALTATSGLTPQPASHSEAATAEADQTAEDPATIRAWARANGLPVGVRGRVSTAVLAAFRAAHPRETASA